MENSRIDAVGLLLAAATATLLFFAIQMNFGYLSSLAGLTLLFVVLAYDQQGYRSGLQSLAFAMVCGACLTLGAGYVLRLVSSPTDPKPDHAVLEEWLGIAWLVGTVVFWGIDRARMGSRQQMAAVAPLPVARSTGQGFIAQSMPATSYVPPAPVPTYAPPPAPAATPTYVPPPAPAYVPPPPPPPPQPVFQQPEPAAPAYVPPPPLIEPISPQVTAPPVIPAVVPVAPPPVHQIPPGKEATIYVNLMGEAMNMLRAVRAESVGRDFYLIADQMPEGEDWEFKPGQIVRCKKKNLSSGKALVAFEEAPRA
jgi:hypothetical protein